ncbi:hypothetical protein [Pandoraea anhela]|uniref:hypothetical protein n=1 Tax=Pandoraea anhela TaxID=2508295 RepID=UPI001242E708|nr:hypothetical protein [Pandoraea anhela]
MTRGLEVDITADRSAKSTTQTKKASENRRAHPGRTQCGREHHRGIAKRREDVNPSALNCKKFSAEAREEDRLPNVFAHLPGGGWFVLQRKFEDCCAAPKLALSALALRGFHGFGACALGVSRGRSNEND